MKELGNKIARKRKDLGMTQAEFAERMSVTRQTVSRWEAGAVLPDIDRIGEIAGLLGVSCDYLLKDEITEEAPSPSADRAAGTADGDRRGISRLLQALKGRCVRLAFFDDEADVDLYNAVCRVMDFEGNWMKVEADLKKGRVEKLIPISSILSFDITEEDR